MPSITVKDPYRFPNKDQLPVLFYCKNQVLEQFLVLALHDIDLNNMSSDMRVMDTNISFHFPFQDEDVWSGELNQTPTNQVWRSPIVPCVGWGTMGDGGVCAVGEGVNQSHVLFDRFVQATTCKGTLKAFQELCDFLELKPSEYRVFYHKLKSKLNYWKAKALWAKLDKRASHKEYKKGRACANSKVWYILHNTNAFFE